MDHRVLEDCLSAVLAVSGLVEEQTARHPDETAVVFRGRDLSYRERNARANRLARELVSLGVVRELPVGISKSVQRRWSSNCSRF